MRRSIAGLDRGRLGPAARLPALAERAIEALERATAWLVETGPAGQAQALAGATPYLRLFGTVAGGAHMARAAGIAAARGGAGESDMFYRAKLATAAFYGDHILPHADALAHAVTDGAESALALAEDEF